MSRPVLVAFSLSVAALGCRGQVGHKPPIHPNWNMDQVTRVDTQEPNSFFADGRGNQRAPEGTVALGTLKEDVHRFDGLSPGGGGAFATALPAGIALDETLLDRGEVRYGIYCSPCHDKAGTGNGMVRQRGFIPPPDFAQDRVRAFPVGQIVNVITHGVRTMPSYAAQVPVADRWAIAAYVRALQLSQSAARADVPADVAQKQGWN